MIDLHTHTTASDGTYSPIQLIDYAIEKKLKALAITDHDTVEALFEALNYMTSITSTSTLELIQGIEFSTNHPDYSFDIHILGLFIDCHHSKFIKGLQSIYEDREARNEKMAHKLRTLGYPITLDAIKKTFPKSVITRAHFAQYLVKHHDFDSMKDVFQKLLGNDQPGYVPREHVPTKDIVALLNETGAIAGLAHPTLYGLKGDHILSFMDAMKKLGVTAVETYYSLHSPTETRMLQNFAKRLDLLQIGGSDFHGANKPGNDLGIGYGHLHVPESLLLPLRRKIKKAK